MEAARLGILARLYCLPRFNYYDYHLFVYRAYAYASTAINPTEPTKQKSRPGR